MCAGYDAKDILDMNKTGIFYCALPDKGLAPKETIAEEGGSPRRDSLSSYAAA